MANQAKALKEPNSTFNGTKPDKGKGFRFYRFLRVILHPINSFLWPTTIVNPENEYKVNGGIFICNHYSKVDALIPTKKMFKDELHVLAKYELFQVKIAGWFLRKMGGIPVRRGEADIDAVKAVLKLLRSNKKLLLFPEGTRNKAGTQEMGEFKDGTARFAIKTRSMVVPMIYYQMPKFGRMNYLYVGEPFDMKDYYGCRTQEDFKVATDFIKQKMLETRVLCNEYAQNAMRCKIGKNK